MIERAYVPVQICKYVQYLSMIARSLIFMPSDSESRQVTGGVNSLPPPCLSGLLAGTGRSIWIVCRYRRLYLSIRSRRGGVPISNGQSRDGIAFNSVLRPLLRI